MKSTIQTSTKTIGLVMSDWTPPEVEKSSSSWSPPEVKDSSTEEKGIVSKVADYAGEKLQSSFGNNGSNPKLDKALFAL